MNTVATLIYIKDDLKETLKKEASELSLTLSSYIKMIIAERKK